LNLISIFLSRQRRFRHAADGFRDAADGVRHAADGVPAASVSATATVQSDADAAPDASAAICTI